MEILLERFLMYHSMKITTIHIGNGKMQKKQMKMLIQQKVSTSENLNAEIPNVMIQLKEDVSHFVTRNAVVI